jgi:hypothetical protein
MTDIHHRIGVQSSSTDDVHAALTTIDGLSGWWTSDTHGDPTWVERIEFRFPQGGFDMEVIELTPGQHESRSDDDHRVLRVHVGDEHARFVRRSPVWEPSTSSI